MTAVSISDPKLGLSTLAVIPSTLAPNAIGTATATYTITQADINVGKLVNTATVTGTAPSGPPVTDVSDSGNEFVDTPEDADADPTNDPTVVPLLQSPAIKLVKMASLSGAGVIGDKITYTFTVTNTGNVPLTAVNIADAKLGLTALVVTPNNLAPNAIGKATATYTITQADIDAGEMKNTATVKGTAPNGISVTDVSDSGDEFLDTTADPDSDPTNDPTVVIFPRMPRFTETSAICSGTTLTALPTTSSNGIIGTWSPALNNTMTTTYTFTPSIGQNAAISTMTITVYAEPSFTLAQTNVTCGGSANGTITVTPTGGQSPFEFSKDDAATFPNINGIFSNLGPGTYKIAIKDANGCIKKCN